jgi:hypothetical protein
VGGKGIFFLGDREGREYMMALGAVEKFPVASYTLDIIVLVSI